MLLTLGSSDNSEWSAWTDSSDDASSLLHAMEQDFGGYDSVDSFGSPGKDSPESSSNDDSDADEEDAEESEAISDGGCQDESASASDSKDKQADVYDRAKFTVEVQSRNLVGNNGIVSHVLISDWVYINPLTRY